MICKKVLPRVALIGCGVMVGIGSGAAAIDLGQTPASSGTGWQLPPDADDKKSPLTPDAKVIATGKSVFKDKCSKCHGASGLGDGPDADPEHREDMDLTNAEARRSQLGRSRLLQGVERPAQAEDDGVQGRIERAADLVGRRLRADAAQEVARLERHRNFTTSSPIA